MPKGAVLTKRNTKPAAKTGKAPAKLNLKTVDRVILYVKDFDKAVRFYSETLGLETAYPAEGGWAEFATAGVRLCIHHGREHAVTSNDAHVAFRTDDFDTTYAELKKRGVAVGKIFSPCGGLRCANFPDPDGNRLGIEGK